jgi:hypothetical protein
MHSRQRGLSVNRSAEREPKPQQKRPHGLRRLLEHPDVPKGVPEQEDVSAVSK